MPVKGDLALECLVAHLAKVRALLGVDLHVRSGWWHNHRVRTCAFDFDDRGSALFRTSPCRPTHRALNLVGGQRSPRFFGLASLVDCQHEDGDSCLPALEAFRAVDIAY
jgi:hypothetical protein